MASSSLEAGGDHRPDGLTGDPRPGRATADDDEPQVGQRRPGDPQSGDDRRDGHRGSALDVVVEREDVVAMASEQPVGMDLREVLPLHEYAGEPTTQGVDERVDELVVLVAPDASVTPAEVERIRQQRLVVGADIEEHRQRP